MINTQVIIYNKPIQRLGYANDLIIMQSLYAYRQEEINMTERLRIAKRPFQCSKIEDNEIEETKMNESNSTMHSTHRIRPNISRTMKLLTKISSMS